MKTDLEKLKKDAVLTLELGKDQKSTHINAEVTRLSDKIKRMTTTKNIAVMVFEKN